MDAKTVIIILLIICILMLCGNRQYERYKECAKHCTADECDCKSEICCRNLPDDCTWSSGSCSKKRR